jgi:hypothetical protein
VIFAPGETTKTVSFTVLGDLLVEANETFTVVLDGAIGAYYSDSTKTATVTITNDDVRPAIALTATDAGGAEQGQDPVVFTVTRTVNLAGTLAVALSWGGQAARGADYTVSVSAGATLSADGLTLTLDDGVSTATLTVTPVDDTAIEGPESVTLSIGSSALYSVTNPATRSGSIADNDRPTVNISSTWLLEGNKKSVTATVTVTLSAPVSDTVTVTVSTQNGTATAGSDYTAKTQTLTFNPGVTSLTFSVTITSDRTKEPNETILVTATSSGATIGTSGTIEIRDDDSPLLASRVGRVAGAPSTAPSRVVLVSALEQAKRYWVRQGASRQSLAGVSVQLANLPGAYLGLTAGRVITLDHDAAGWGWSTASGSRGRMGLVSVLVHELGHVLGFDHDHGGVMAERMAPGGRPTATAPVRASVGRTRPASRVEAVATVPARPVAPVTRTVDRTTRYAWRWM